MSLPCPSSALVLLRLIVTVPPPTSPAPAGPYSVSSSVSALSRPFTCKAPLSCNSSASQSPAVSRLPLSFTCWRLRLPARTSPCPRSVPPVIPS
ncbi:hypothetical protein D3C73_1174490 [compost metagenome]